MSRSSRHNLCYSYARCLFRYLDFSWWHIINVSGVTTMSSHVWCHGPNCHTYVTTDRVRGSKGSKVLRTRKVKQHNGIQLGTSFYNWFCSNGCYNDFANKHVEQIIRIEPRTEPLETKIEDPKKVKHESDYVYSDGTRHTWTTTEIKKIDTSSDVG